MTIRLHALYDELLVPTESVPKSQLELENKISLVFIIYESLFKCIWDLDFVRMSLFTIVIFILFSGIFS